MWLDEFEELYISPLLLRYDFLFKEPSKLLWQTMHYTKDHF